MLMARHAAQPLSWMESSIERGCVDVIAADPLVKGKAEPGLSDHFLIGDRRGDRTVARISSPPLFRPT
jgi:hypothetical protein